MIHLIYLYDISLYLYDKCNVYYAVSKCSTSTCTNQYKIRDIVLLSHTGAYFILLSAMKNNNKEQFHLHDFNTHNSSSRSDITYQLPHYHIIEHDTSVVDLFIHFIRDGPMHDWLTNSSHFIKSEY